MRKEHYEFDHYPSDLYTINKKETVFIKTEVLLEFDDDGTLVRGSQESQFGKGDIVKINQVQDGYSFALDMGGGRVNWYRLHRENDQLIGIANAWGGNVTWPYYFMATKTVGNDSVPTGLYDINVYNGDMDTSAASSEWLCKGWMELIASVGTVDGWMELPLIRGQVCDFVERDGDYFFRYTLCNNNQWFRMYRKGKNQWEGHVTGYPFHFAWPFHIVGTCKDRRK